MESICTRFTRIETRKDVIHKVAMNWLRNSRDWHAGRKERTKRKIHGNEDNLNSDNFNNSQNSTDKSFVSDSQGWNYLFSEWGQFPKIENGNLCCYFWQLQL